MPIGICQSVGPFKLRPFIDTFRPSLHSAKCPSVPAVPTPPLRTPNPRNLSLTGLTNQMPITPVITHTKMAQSVTLRSMATIVARQSAKYSSTQQLRYYANWRNCALYRQTVSIATNAAPLRTHIIPVIPCFQSFYSTSAPDPAASSGGLRPPDHLDEKERDIFTKLVAQLEPSRLEVCFYRLVLLQTEIQTEIPSYTVINLASIYTTHSDPCVPCCIGAQCTLLA